MPNDVPVLSSKEDQYKDWFKFNKIEIEESKINNIINKCKKFTSKYKNIYAKTDQIIADLNKKAIPDWKSLLALTEKHFSASEIYNEIIKTHYTRDLDEYNLNEKSIFGFITFISKNKNKYKEMVSLIENDKGQYYSYEAGGYKEYSYYYKNKTTPHSIQVIDLLKKKGGLKKALQDKNLAKKLTELLA